MLASGDVLRERYVIEGVLARGGMSVLYRASDRHLPGAWVVKEMMETVPNPEDREMIHEQFKREAAILSTLSHPGLPRVIDFFEQHERLYLVEEFVAGETMRAMLERRDRVPEDEAVQFALQLLDVLGYLHEHGIVYRDLKPDNIIVTPEGNARLVDFGIARLFTVGKRRDTVLMGTPGFASPEHYGQRQTDARSDIYSLGATMHYLVTGRDPGDSPFLFEPPNQIVPGSDWFTDIVMMALESDPDERFQSAPEMRAALASPRHLPLRARKFEYLTPPSFLPSWERGLQAVSGMSAGFGGLWLAFADPSGLALLWFFFLHPMMLLGRYAHEHRLLRGKSFIATPQELHIWADDQPTKVPWKNLLWVRAKKYQRLVRRKRDIGERRGVDTSIEVALVAFGFIDPKWDPGMPVPLATHSSHAPGGTRAHPAEIVVLFSSQLDGWNELLQTIVARGGLRPQIRTDLEEADEVYVR